MSFAIALHLTSVLPALVIGSVILFNAKGTLTHKRLGRIWLGLMLLTSIVSFFIRHDGRFSWIHLLSLITLASLGIALWAIRQGRVDVHRGFMIDAFVGAIIAGIFASLLPERLLYNFLFGA